MATASECCAAVLPGGSANCLKDLPGMLASLLPMSAVRMRVKTQNVNGRTYIHAARLRLRLERCTDIPRPHSPTYVYNCTFRRPEIREVTVMERFKSALTTAAMYPVCIILHYTID